MEPVINADKVPVGIEQRSAILAQVLSRDYISIAELNLLTGCAVVLKSLEDIEFEGREVPWGTLVRRYAKRRAYPEDRGLVRSLTIESLGSFLESGREELSIELRCVSDTDTFIWVEICISVLSASEKKLLVTTRNINEARIMQSIVELYVFQDMDYFILLDAVHDTYTMYSGRHHGTPLPSKHSDAYTAEMVSYNQQYVVPEDQERVTASMQIPHVLAMLEKEERYSIYCGAISDTGTYRRTWVQYQYYDRSLKLILLTRTDITQIYQEEQANHNRLAAALRDAQHDALTDIYNPKATAELISRTLEGRYWNQAAFLFVDVDNFKMVNDTLGHQTGDKLLRFVADALQDLAGRDGIAGRVGGDEFLLFFPSESGMEAVERRAAKICRIFDFLPDGVSNNLPISCSVGISVYPKDGTDYETLVRKADQALYTSKRYGKNRYYYYSQDVHDRI